MMNPAANWLARRWREIRILYGKFHGASEMLNSFEIYLTSAELKTYQSIQTFEKYVRGG